MTGSEHSNYWYRVARLKPALRDSVIISRHVYRRQAWYILRNTISGMSHRFNTAAFGLIGQMNGSLTIQELWDNLEDKDGNAPTQDEMILLLGQLYNADLIQSDILPSTVDILRQSMGKEERIRRKKVTNPFSMRFSLWDPDEFLTRWSFLVSPFFGRISFFVWFFIIGWAGLATITHWPELSGRLADQLFMPQNLIMLWLTYPLVKIFHEFGHAFAVKKWGGEVHEMGIMLLAFTPIPYIDATSSASFAEKERRIAVAAMGIMVELLLASTALFIWLNVETGIVSAVAYNVMLIAGFSTLLFNGNPLLRFDGYYIFIDIVEIPNLAQRSRQYTSYLLKKYILDIGTTESQTLAPGERGWFFLYGPASFIYRIAVVIGIIWFVSDRFFIIGILIACWGVVSLIVLPSFRAVKSFLDNPEVQERKPRLIVLGSCFSLCMVFALFLMQVPLRTTTQGVVWMPEQSSIRAGVDCEIVELFATSKEKVDKGAQLLKGADPFLEAEVKIIRAQLQEMVASYNGIPLYKRVNRRIILDEITRLKAELEISEEQQTKLLFTSPASGIFMPFDHHNLEGRFVRQGELIGYIVADHRPTIRAVISQGDIGLIRKKVTDIEIRFAENLTASYKARLERVVPAAGLQLPSAALGTAGGGQIVVDPKDPKGLRALETYFELDLSLPEELDNLHIGGRVFVQIDHGSMPLARQWYRKLRQLLLRKFYA